MFRSPICRVGRVLFSSGSSSSALASIENAFLDPSKHFAMNKMPHCVYVDYYNVGQYPELTLIGSVAPTTYQPQVETLLTNFLNQKYVDIR